MSKVANTPKFKSLTDERIAAGHYLHSHSPAAVGHLRQWREQGLQPCVM